MNALLEKIEKNFDKAANTYDDNAIVQVKAGELLLKFIEKYNTIPIKSITDLGAGTGQFSQKLQTRFSSAKVCAFDLSHKMMAVSQKRNTDIYCIQGNFDAMPFKSSSTDLIFSNYSLQWSLDLEKTFTEINRILKTNGLFVFSIPGPSTLYELKNAFKKIDHYTHINQFYARNQIEQRLKYYQIKIIDSHTEYFKLYFKNIFLLLKHLKLSGANSIIAKDPHKSIKKNLSTPNNLIALSQAYQTYQENNFYPATYETLFFIAKKED